MSRVCRYLLQQPYNGESTYVSDPETVEEPFVICLQLFPLKHTLGMTFNTYVSEVIVRHIFYGQTVNGHTNLTWQYITLILLLFSHTNQLENR